MYMYINQLIVGIQLCYTVTSIRELFLFPSYLRFFFPRLFLFVLIESSFFFFPDVYLCCNSEEPAPGAR